MKSFFIAALVLVTQFAFAAQAQGLFKEGDKMPDFRLPYATRDTIVFEGIGSQDLQGKRYLLAFYPADWSSGCTKEVCRFRDSMADFEDLGLIVLGISVDSPFAHHEWSKQQNLNFKLLSDQTHNFGKAMGVYNEQFGVFKRSVFVVGPDGKLEYINYNYSVRDEKDFNTLKGAVTEE
jgi:peroxiredoxin